MSNPTRSRKTKGVQPRLLHAVVMPVCYKMSGTDEIQWGNAVRKKGRGIKAIIFFDDEGWMPAGECFFTEAQCRSFHKMPPKDWQAVNEKVADRLEKMAEAIRA